MRYLFFWLFFGFCANLISTAPPALFRQIFIKCSGDCSNYSRKCNTYQNMLLNNLVSVWLSCECVNFIWFPETLTQIDNSLADKLWTKLLNDISRSLTGNFVASLNYLSNSCCFLTKLFSKLFTTGKQKTMNWFPNARNYDHILKSCELHNTQIFVEVTSLITN